MRSYDDDPSRGDQEGLAVFLEKIGPQARADLLRVLTSRSDVRADVIRQFCERPGGQDMGELLIELETNDFARAAALDQLRHWPTGSSSA